MCIYKKADLFQELCITTNTNNVYVTIPTVLFNSVPGEYSFLFLKNSSENRFQLWVASPVTKSFNVGFVLFS